MSINKSVGFSPASVTCFFSPEMGESFETTYSKGCALNLDRGVEAVLEAASDTEILFNGQAKSIAPLEYIVKKLSPEPIKISLQSSLPLGCGFGLSAASCLSTAFAIVDKYSLILSRIEIGMMAHEAEVKYKTGLGDVSAQLCGGVVYRRCEQGPLDAEQLLVKPEPMYFRIFGELETAATLNNGDLLNMLAKEGAKSSRWLKDNFNALSLDRILACSRIFAEDVHLITNKNVRSCIDEVLAQGGQATMIMLGQAVLSTMAVGDLSQWTKCTIDNKGTRIIENGRPD